MMYVNMDLSAFLGDMFICGANEGMCGSNI